MHIPRPTKLRDAHVAAADTEKPEIKSQFWSARKLPMINMGETITWTAMGSSPFLTTEQFRYSCCSL